MLVVKTWGKEWEKKLLETVLEVLEKLGLSLQQMMLK